MAKAKRTGKVFVDWSQNDRHKTTVNVYSLRAMERPTVSTPVSWDEVSDAADGSALSFTADEVLERVASLGDLFAPVQTLEQELPEL
jgi:bifunctional non-homologous end joining protein LigD